MARARPAAQTTGPGGEQGRRRRSGLSGSACGFGAGGGRLSSTSATNQVTDGGCVGMAVGTYFSGLRLDSRRLSSSSIPSSPSSASYNGMADASAAAALGLAPPTARHHRDRVPGGTASGKTTDCNMTIQQLHDHRVVLVNQMHLIQSDLWSV